jgi:hypothetical protein
MNERIEKLAERATEEMNPEAFSEDMNIPTEWYHKFAELLIQECMTVCQKIDKEYDGEDVLATWCATEIGKHFGVEE